MSFTPRHMPLVRVRLECTRPGSSAREVATFHVVVTDEQHAHGAHLGLAERRAGIRGYAPPYRCVSEEVALSAAQPVMRHAAPDEPESLRGRVTKHVRQLAEEATGVAVPPTAKGEGEPAPSAKHRTGHTLPMKGSSRRGRVRGG